ncbi:MULTISPECIES: HK97-gp10 family putative phage morphogenesis protein [Macrococcoides]|uniref:HK97 gp10 family phage protein n=1 Tax=Macrococcoides bohemicum TaxID=1903056 RepID=A0A328A6S1_9STAP|nr:MULTISPECIES: HK97-gp10 family putative phage morphogenesis protein [Macrococcus]QNR08237.1 hypothetical protein GL258_08180 [Macrococcus canis]RAK50200.1 hypothetical protein BHX94_01685 [Macrococcus bohemicus]UTG99323.1 hypothetical protein KFV04_07365 [Macrococcus canis]
MSNENGFESQVDQINKLLDVNKTVTLEVRKKAAEYFISKLKPNIPVSKRNAKHMNAALDVRIEGDEVKVYFEDYAFYWRFVDKGTSKQRAQNFVTRTLTAEEQRIKDIMINEIVEKMEA